MKFSDPGHPIWGALRVVGVLVWLTVTLAWQAEHFDHTELYTLAVMTAILMGQEGSLLVIFRKLLGASDDQKERD